MKSTTIISVIITAFALAGCSTSAPTTESKIQSPADLAKSARVAKAKRKLVQPKREIEFHFHVTQAPAVGRTAGEPSGTRLQPGVTAKPKSLFGEQ